MKVWNYLFQGLGLLNNSNMQNEIECLLKASLNLLQGILLMHDMAWDTALREQHPVYTYLRPALSTSTRSVLHATKLIILSSSVISSKCQWSHDVMTAGLKEILLAHPLKWFISWGHRASFLPFLQIHIHIYTHKYTKHHYFLIYTSEQNWN